MIRNPFFTSLSKNKSLPRRAFFYPGVLSCRNPFIMESFESPVLFLMNVVICRLESLSNFWSSRPWSFFHLPIISYSWVRFCRFPPLLCIFSRRWCGSGPFWTRSWSNLPGWTIRIRMPLWQAITLTFVLFQHKFCYLTCFPWTCFRFQRWASAI